MYSQASRESIETAKKQVITSLDGSRKGGVPSRKWLPASGPELRGRPEAGRRCSDGCQVAVLIALICKLSELKTNE